MSATKGSRVRLDPMETALLANFRRRKATIATTISHAQDMIRMDVDELEQLTGAKVGDDVLPKPVRDFLAYKPDVPRSAAAEATQAPPAAVAPAPQAGDEKKAGKRRRRRFLSAPKAEGVLSFAEVRQPVIQAIVDIVGGGKKQFTLIDVTEALDKRKIKYIRSNVSLVLSKWLNGIKVAGTQARQGGGPPMNLYEVTSPTITVRDPKEMKKGKK